MVEFIYQGLFRGAAWTVAMRWVLRFIGLINIIILARLLTPFDIGLIAMATLVSTFASNFTEMGAQQLLIRQQNITIDDIDAAWTIHVIQGLLVSGMILLISPLATMYFNDSRVHGVLVALALVPLIRGFRNIGLTLAKRELDFFVDFRAQVYSKLLSFVITLALIFWLRSCWALVMGSVIGAGLEVWISYRIHSYRPRISTHHIKPYIRFAKSIIPLRIARYGNTKSGIITASGMATSGQFGVFNLAADFSNMVSNELVVPLTAGLFPGYAKLNHNLPMLAKVFENMLNTAASLLLPIGVGLALVAEDLVPLILGPKWLESIIYIQWFAVAGAIASVNHMMNLHIFIASGNEARAARISWIRLCLFMPTVFAAGHLGGLYAIAQASLYFDLLFFPISVFSLTRSIPISVRRIILAIIRPFLATLVMACSVALVQLWDVDHGMARLVLSISLGALTYIFSLYVMWNIAKCPNGAEQLLYNFVRRKLNPNTAR